jgi:CMP-N-acetylneuraminic acid synthetase
MHVVGIIPARAGSKTIKNKNIANFCGKPLIAWAILAARRSKKVDRVIVSTDSPAIARIATRYGAEVPFVRPRSLAGPRVGVEPVLRHAYEWLRAHERLTADALVLLLPTNPLRQPFHLDEAIRLFTRTGCDSVVAVNETPANHTPYWTLVRDARGRVSLFGGDPLTRMPVRRQDFPNRCFARNDLVFVVKPSNLYERPSNLYGSKVQLYETSPRFEADINTKDDWHEAELRFTRLGRHR